MKDRELKPLEIAQAFAVVAALLAVVWFMEAGSKLASGIFGVVTIVGNIWLYFAVKRSRRDKPTSTD